MHGSQKRSENFRPCGKFFQIGGRPRTAPENDLLNDLNTPFPVFHWHGDTFDLPDDAQPLLQSKACTNQAFLYHENVLGLQFHFEVTAESLRAMLLRARSRREVQSPMKPRMARRSTPDHVHSGAP